MGSDNSVVMAKLGWRQLHLKQKLKENNYKTRNQYVKRMNHQIAVSLITQAENMEEG